MRQSGIIFAECLCVTKIVGNFAAEKRIKVNLKPIGMNDKELVEALLRHDRFVTQLFFYRNCRPLFMGLIQRFSTKTKQWEYDELVSEVYLLLMEDEGRRLRLFTFKSSFYQWLKVVTMRMMAEREDVVIDEESKMPLYEKNGDGSRNGEQSPESETSGRYAEAKDDLERLLKKMPNQRYAMVIRRMTIEGYEPEELAREMDVNVANLYNIKRRAMKQLTEVALQDKRMYQLSTKYNL